jgi:two-component system response regulator AtoC
MRQLRERDPALPVIMLTAHGSERAAVAAMKAGAWDYLTKPFDTDELLLTVERALETGRLRALSRRLSAERALNLHIIGTSPAMRRLLATVERIAARDITVLLRGETGTGKELIASLLHAQSARAPKPLVRFNCAAIPAELAEAELFGHARGAFTGANVARRGFVAQADGGTLVLDEIGELSAPVQAKLLRLLQEREIQPLGAGRVEHVDVRVVASTHRDLQAEVRAGRFREDLYYRLAVIELKVPSLGERREDIAPLAVEFARRYADKFGIERFELSPELVARLEQRAWPGNVRQLENTIARLAALSPGGMLPALALDDPAEAQPDAGTAEQGPSLREQVEAFERNLIARALAKAGGNQSEAARQLQTSRVTLIDKLKKYRLLGSD